MSTLKALLWLGCFCSVHALAQLPSNLSFDVPSRAEWATTFNGEDTANCDSVVLDFEVRFETSAENFLWPALEMELNDVRIEPITEHNGVLVSRLENKPLEYVTRLRGLVPWHWGSGWLVYTQSAFAFPSGKDAFWPAEPGSENQIYRFRLEIKDLVQAGSNRLVFRNINSQYNGTLKFRSTSLVCGNTPGYSDQLPPIDSVANGYQSDGLNGNYQFTVDANGAAELTVNGETFLLDSQVTWNDGQTIVSCDLLQSANCWASFQVSTANDQWVITATTATPGLTITRTFTKLPDRVSVTDQIDNTGGNVHGVQLHRRLLHDSAPSPRFAYMGGRKMQHPTSGTQTLDELQPNNPSVYLEGAAAGVGMVAVDDLARTHFEAVLDPNAVAMATEDLRLPATATLTAEWALIPTASADYFAMVNPIRDDWNLNYATDGRLMVIMPSTVQTMDIGILADRLRRNRTRTLVLAAVRDTDIGADHLPANFPRNPNDPIELHGYAFNYALSHNAGPQNEVVKLINEATARVKSIDPGIQVLFYFNTFLTTEDPANPNADNWYLYKPASTSVPNLPADRYEYVPNRIFYAQYGFGPGAADPFRDNVLTPAVTGMLTHLTVDGLFWDLFSGANIHRSYQTQHPNSIEVDGANAGREYLEMISASAAINRQILEDIYAAGKFVITNEGAASQTLMTAATDNHVLNVHEDNLPHRISSGLLSTPLAFRIPEILPRHVLANMRHTIMFGMLYSTYQDIPAPQPYWPLQAIHPFEPRELHRGYLLGRNKIVTVRSGRFGWDATDTDDIRIRLFDENGVAQSIQAPPFESNGRLLVDVTVPWGSLAVLERRGLQADWRFEENTGSTIAGGNGPSGTLSGTGQLGATGRIGLGLNLAGGQVTLDADPILQSAAFAVSAWVKPETGHASQPLFGWDGEVGFDVAVLEDQTTKMRIQLGPLHYRDFESPANLFDGQYHHVVMAADGNAGLTATAVFVDGVPMAPLASVTDDVPAPRGPAAIGALGTNQFKGGLDEVRFYNYVPSVTQAQALFREASLVGLWSPARDADGWAFSDLSTYSLHPSLNGSIDLDQNMVAAPTGLALSYPITREPTPGNETFYDPKINGTNTLRYSGHGISLSAWINPRDLAASTTNGQAILNLGDWNTTNQYYLGFYQNKFRFVVGDNWAGGVQIPQSHFNDNAWYHVLGSADAAGHRLYINGVKVAESNQAAGLTSANAFSLYIGRLSNGAKGRFEGFIAAPQVEMRAFTDAEIEARFAAATLAAHWRLDETESNVAFDSSGRGHHLTFVNGAFQENPIGGFTALDKTAQQHLHLADDSELAAYTGAVGNSTDQLTMVFHGVSLSATAPIPDSSLIFKSNDTDEPGYFLGIVNSRLHVKHGNDTLWAAQDHPLQPGQWFHVVATVDQGLYRLFLNGAEVPLTATLLQGPSSFALDGFYLGGRQNGGWLNGNVADARIYRHALPAGSVADLYETVRTAAALPITATNGVTSADESGNGNHGLANGVEFADGHAVFDEESTIHVPHHPSLEPLDRHFTISARIRWTDETALTGAILFPGKPVNIVSKGDWNQSDFYGLILYQNKLRFGFGQNWGQSLQVSLDFLEANTWYTITGVIDGDDQRLYVDGQEMDGSEVTPGFPNTVNSLLIGHADSDSSFKGNIEAVSVHQVALAPTDMGLLGHWRFDGNGRDSSDFRNHSEPAEATYAVGNVGHALALAGNRTAMTEVAHQDSFNPAGDFTISAWIKPTTLDSNSAFGDTILSKGYWGGTNNFYLGFYQGKLRFTAGQVWSQGVNVPIAETGVSAGRWYLVTAVREGDQLTLYVDACMRGSITDAGASINTQQPLMIGSMESTSLFDGLIDDVRFYDRALTEASIQALLWAGNP